MTALARTLAPGPVIEAANHPDVRPWIGPLESGFADPSVLVQDPANVTFGNEHGAFICHNQGGGLYEAHSIFAPEAWGKVKAGADATFALLFGATDCLVVRTKLPENNPRAAALAHRVGFEDLFTRPDTWPTPEGGRCAVTYCDLSLDRWVATAPGLISRGKALADLCGLTVADEPALRSLGAFAAMACAGNVEKASRFYLSRAVFADLPPIHIMTLQPLLFALNGKTVQTLAGCFEVIS